ncbi:hypothetical protein TRFO_31484 [Tritrichomonas foetus]|uniref:Protein kinase domain-containing protein n=1 Tax=Tritrichomonas foetus TaxID=1144522 RepID=A0A1J4JRJ1_9EUKA|nr:hypothetical protein TRFO_31484 [Tritrichomonas foetus]|eukprot:OHT01651.1 hypothetical protein TRFO_31484 [Tritrichomonas foetus]
MNFESPALLNYFVKSRIGTGAISTIYLAQQIDTQEEVAIKITPKAKLLNQTERDRLIKERYILSNVSHFNIVRFLGFSEDDENYYLFTEYFKGRSLLSIIQSDGALQDWKVSNITFQIDSALKYLHEKGIAHHDLKPDNIVVNELDMKVKLIDFGLADYYQTNSSDISSNPIMKRITFPDLSFNNSPILNNFNNSSIVRASENVKSMIQADSNSSSLNRSDFESNGCSNTGNSFSNNHECEPIANETRVLNGNSLNTPISYRSIFIPNSSLNKGMDSDSVKKMENNYLQNLINDSIPHIEDKHYISSHKGNRSSSFSGNETKTSILGNPNSIQVSANSYTDAGNTMLQIDLPSSDQSTNSPQNTSSDNNIYESSEDTSEKTELHLNPIISSGCTTRNYVNKKTRAISQSKSVGSNGHSVRGCSSFFASYFTKTTPIPQVNTINSHNKTWHNININLNSDLNNHLPNRVGGLSSNISSNNSSSDSGNITEKKAEFRKNTLSNNFYGSLEYVAPELVQRIPYDPFAADIWSFGLCIYAMLTGFLPWSSNDPNQMMKEIVSCQINFYEDVINDKFVNLLKRLLVKEAADRMTADEIFQTSYDWSVGNDHFDSVEPAGRTGAHKSGISASNSMKQSAMQNLRRHICGRRSSICLNLSGPTSPVSTIRSSPSRNDNVRLTLPSLKPKGLL